MDYVQQKSEVLFRFDSRNHPACAVFIGGLDSRHFEVVALRDYFALDSPGEPGVAGKATGATRVHGHIFDYHPKEFTLNNSKPFNIEVHTYDPINDITYVMAVLHAYITDDATGAFCAAALRPWYAINGKKPITIPRHWTEVSVPVRYEGPNKNGDDFSSCVGKIQSWEPEQRAYAHIDKSIPERTYDMDSKTSGIAGTVTVARINCTFCGTEKSVDVVTGKCDVCGELLSVLREAPKVADVMTTTNKVSVGAKVNQPKCGICSQDAPIRKCLKDMQPGTIFDLGNGTQVVRGDKTFKELTKGGVGLVVADGSVWYNNSGNFPAENKFQVLHNVVKEIEDTYHLLDIWHTENTPQDQLQEIRAAIKRHKTYMSNVHRLLDVHNPEDAYTRINALIEIERKEMRQQEAVFDGVKCFGNDTAHVGPWTTVRACIDCGVLITGGPTRCTYCAEKPVVTTLEETQSPVTKVPTVNFHTVIGVRLQKTDLKIYSKEDLANACNGVAHLLETDQHVYVCTWSRTIHCVRGRAENAEPLVNYPERIIESRKMLLDVLEPRGLWYPGQFGVWSFALSY
jgi:hypothetical protein